MYAIKRLHNHLYLVIIVAWVLFCSPYFFSGKTPYPSNYQVNFFSPWNMYPGLSGPVKNNAQPDIIGQIYPWRHFTIDELKKGQIPFWNPYSFAGTPHLANYQSAVLFPLNALFFLPIPFIDAWSWLVLLQPLMAGIFMYLFVRKLGISKYSSLVSSLSFMFCGFIVTWLGYATLGYAILPLPLALYFVLSYLDREKMRWAIAFSLTFPLSFFAGHFQTSIYFALGVILFIMYHLITYKKKKALLKILLFFLFGILLTFPQVLPSMEFYSQSVRSDLYQKVEAIPLQYLITFMSPDFFGNPVTRNDWFGHYAEWNGFSGILVLALALLAVILNRTKKTFFFIILASISLLLAFDTPFQSILVALKIPVLSTSAASRIIVLFSFSIAVLGGFGMEALVKNFQKGKKALIVWFICFTGVFATLATVGFLSVTDGEKMAIAQKNILLPIFLFVALSGMIFASFLVKNKKYVYVLIGGICLLVSFEMFRFASKWQNFDPKNYVYPHVKVGDFYGRQNHYDRAIGLSGAEDAVYFKIPVLTGYDPLYKQEYGEFIQYVGQGKIRKPERSVVTFPYKGEYTKEAINFMGVHFIVHKVSDGTFPWAFPFSDFPISQFSIVYEDHSYKVFRNNDAFPRAFIVGETKVLPHKQIPDFMFENDLKKVAAVEKTSAFVSSNATGDVKILSYEPGSIKMNVKASDNAFLVLTDNYYPGWNATVNGKKSEIYKTNYTFRGIILPKGESTIHFSYMPQSFFVGIYFALIGLLGIVVSIIMKRLTIAK